jgi:amidophosphoribosyltransferase
MCGICGFFQTYENDSAMKVAKVLRRLQHRGQESAGISVATDSGITTRKEIGLVSHVSAIGDWQELVGRMAIGHVRYSTKGKLTVKNACPMEEPSPIGRIAISYNGNLVNANFLREKLAQEGFMFETTTDTEVIIKCLAFHIRENMNIITAIKKCMEEFNGAYSIVVLTTQGIYGFRDPHGIRPMCVGKINGGYMISSETCALSVVGAVFIREIANGEIVAITDEGLAYYSGLTQCPAACLFEFIYMARPDSDINGINLSQFRIKCGEVLASEARFYDGEGGIIIPMVNTGLPAADGYAWQSKKRIVPAVVKDRYQPERTFIRPDQEDRDNGIDAFSVIDELVYGQILYVVDDSIVRGSTKRKMVKRFRDAGAKEVHIRIASPPYIQPCYMGVDTALASKLIANGKTIEEVRQEIEADSLIYLSLEGIYKAMGKPRGYFCDGCLTGEYPIDLSSCENLSKDSLELNFV